MPSPIQTGGTGSPSLLLTAAFGLVGRFPTSMDENLVGNAVIADLSQAGPIPVTRIASASCTINAVVAEFAVARLELPTGIVGRVRAIWLAVAGVAPTFANVFFGSSIAAPAGAAGKAYTDGRLRAMQLTPAGVLAFGTQAAGLAATHARLPMEIDAGIRIPVDWVFGRTDAFDFIEIQCATANLQARVVMEWIEALG